MDEGCETPATNMTAYMERGSPPAGWPAPGHGPWRPASRRPAAAASGSCPAPGPAPAWSPPAERPSEPRRRSHRWVLHHGLHQRRRQHWRLCSVARCRLRCPGRAAASPMMVLRPTRDAARWLSSQQAARLDSGAAGRVRGVKASAHSWRAERRATAPRTARTRGRRRRWTRRSACCPPSIGESWRTAPWHRTSSTPERGGSCLRATMASASAAG